MKKKILGIAQIVFSLAGALMLVFVPLFKRSLVVKSSSLGVSQPISARDASILDNALNNDPLVNQSSLTLIKIFGIALISVAAISILLEAIKFIAQCTDKLEKFSHSKLTVIFPIISVILAVVFMIVASDYSIGSYNGLEMCYANTPYPSFFLCVFCLLATAVLDILGSSKWATSDNR